MKPHYRTAAEFLADFTREMATRPTATVKPALQPTRLEQKWVRQDELSYTKPRRLGRVR